MESSSNQPRSSLPLLIVGAIGIVVGYVVAEQVNKYEQQAAIEVNWNYAPAKQKRLAKAAEDTSVKQAVQPQEPAKSTH